MSTIANDNADVSTAASPLDARRDELTARLRAARAALSPKAAVAAVAASGDVSEAADLAVSIVADKAAARPVGFQPRSMTMKLILERPDVTLRVAVALATMVFGARMVTQLGSAAAIVRVLRQTLETLTGERPPPA